VPQHGPLMSQPGVHRTQRELDESRARQPLSWAATLGIVALGCASTVYFCRYWNVSPNRSAAELEGRLQTIERRLSKLEARPTRDTALSRAWGTTSHPQFSAEEATSVGKPRATTNATLPTASKPGGSWTPPGVRPSVANVSHKGLDVQPALLQGGLPVAFSQDLLHYRAQPRGSKLTVEGTSSIHDWTITSAVVAGSFDVEPAFESDKTLSTVPSLAESGVSPNLNVVVPVRSLKSGHEKMDEVMQEALRMVDTPSIHYRATEMRIKGRVPWSGTPVTLATKGTLAIAGITNTVEMDVVMDRSRDNSLRFTGSKGLKMSDFGISPPRVSSLGITAGDAVKVSFEWNLELRQEAASR